MAEDNFAAIIRLLRDNKVTIKIGILDNNVRAAEKGANSGSAPLGNADVGAIHEFGGWVNGARIPRRSWLRMPLETQFTKFFKSADITEETLKRALKAGNLDPIAAKLARVAKECVDAGFDSGGFGIWPPHSPSYKNSTGNLLDDTGQLKAAVSTQIVKKS